MCVSRLMYSSSSELEYAYPLPTPAILSNISSALLSVPRLYEQLLHLMNKMNLPPPFDETPFPSLPRLSGLRRQREQQQQQGDGGGSSESESEAEVDMDSRAPKRARRQRHPVKIVLHSKPCPERQVLSMEQIVSHRLSNERVCACHCSRPPSPPLSQSVCGRDRRESVVEEGSWVVRTWNAIAGSFSQERGQGRHRTGVIRHVRPLLRLRRGHESVGPRVTALPLSVISLTRTGASTFA